MKVEYINPFIISTRTAFETMLQLEVQRTNLFTSDNSSPVYDITGMIGLSGKAMGSVAVSLSSTLALKATEILLEEPQLAINADVADSVGELANIVAGGAKAQLEDFAMRITLPTVIVGKTKCVAFPRNVSPICIGFDSQWGEFCIQVGMVDVPAEALVEPSIA